MGKKNPSHAYEIGFGRPPKSGQFKPGISGNKRGRPKARPTLQTDVSAELNKKIVVNINGKPEKMTVRTAIVKRLLHTALTGDHKAIGYVFSVSSQVEHEPEPKMDLPDLSNLTEKELTDLYREEASKAR